MKSGMCLCVFGRAAGVGGGAGRKHFKQKEDLHRKEWYKKETGRQDGAKRATERERDSRVESEPGKAKK